MPCVPKLHAACTSAVIRQDIAAFVWGCTYIHEHVPLPTQLTCACTAWVAPDSTTSAGRIAAASRTENLLCDRSRCFRRLRHCSDGSVSSRQATRPRPFRAGSAAVPMSSCWKQAPTPQHEQHYMSSCCMTMHSCSRGRGSGSAAINIDQFAETSTFLLFSAIYHVPMVLQLLR